MRKNQRVLSLVKKPLLQKRKNQKKIEINKHYKGFLLFIIFIIIIILFLSIFHFRQKYKEKIVLQELIRNEIENLGKNKTYFNDDIIINQNISNISEVILKKDVDKEFKDMQEYIYMSMALN